MYKILLFVLMFVSCTPQQQLNRAFDKINRLQREHPELFKSDTAIIKDVIVRERIDTFFINDVQMDSIFIVERDTIGRVDTLRISKDGVKTEVVIRVQNLTVTEYEVITQIDSFQVERIVRDTIFKEIIKIENTNQRKPWWWSSTWLLFLIFIVIGFIAIVRWLQNIFKGAF